MKEIIIDSKNKNQRLDKFLSKYFKEASMGFLYKMLRKKNITLNNKKATGKEVLDEQDIIKVFFSDETFLKMKGENSNLSSYLINEDSDLSVLYENDDILVINKPKNLLSQKAKVKDISVNEMALSYLIRKGEVTTESLHYYKPSVMNRLDRNTSGIVLVAKTLKGAHYLSDVISDIGHPKIYYCICKGRLNQDFMWKDYLVKDEEKNIVRIYKNEQKDAKEIITGVHPIESNQELSMVEVKLFTGRPHQIRAHLSSKGYPVIGDTKYGDRKTNDFFKKNYGITSQMLHSYKIILPQIGEICAPIPKEFEKIMKEVN